jgi:hypothetical protein
LKEKMEKLIELYELYRFIVVVLLIG